MDLNGQEKKYLGQGWSYNFGSGRPLGVGVSGRGGLAMSKDEADIESAIKIVLATSRGERVMRPEFGSTIHEYVFAPNNATTHGLLAYHVRDALRRWEPRIEVIEVDVKADIVDRSRVLINIQYQVKATNDERNLVYPFYLVPLEE